MFDAHRHGDLIRLRTSGTSGRARSVVRTTASWFASFPHVSELLHLDARSSLRVPGPLASTMNLFATVHARHVGATVLPGPLGASPATHAVLTPAALSRALTQAADLRGVHVLVAGDRMEERLHDAALRAGVSAVSHYYGAAELSFVAWGSHADDLRPFPGVELECRAGEIWVRSPYVCERYDGPGGVLRRGPDAFVTVGDRGRVEAGRVVVHGRGDAGVVTAGVTVHVADVEWALRGPEGTDVVVVGVPHPDLGQVLCAVLREADQVPRVRRRAREVLDPTHRPRRWFAVPSPPVTDAGKLDRRRLVDVLVSGGEGARRLG